MSEFRIVKCKKCNASLTEIAGEKLKSCVQCGHSFALTIEDKPSILTTIRNNNNKISRSTATTANTTTTKKTSTTVTPKKNKSIVGTIVKWYFIIWISLSVLSRFF